LTLEKREVVPLSTGKAFLVIGRQEIDKTKVRKWILVASSPALTALVAVQIPEPAKALYPDAAIRAALASLAIRAAVPIEEELGVLPFKIGDLAGFRVAGVVPGRSAALSDAPTDASPNAPIAPHLGGAYLQVVGVARADAWKDAYPRFRTVRDSIGSR
jgi:hypothetical protein